MEFIVETGMNVPGANSLVSTGESDTFMFFDPFRGVTWTGLDINLKQKLLVTATSFLESNFEFAGVRTYPDQALSWPRDRVYNRETGYYLPKDIVPLNVRKAVVEIALWINDKQNANLDGVDGISVVSTEDFSVSFDLAARSDAIPSTIGRLLLGYGSFQSGAVTHVKIKKA